MKLKALDLLRLRSLQKAAQAASLEAQRQQLTAQEASIELEQATWQIEENYGLVGQHPEFNLRTGEIRVAVETEES